MGLVDYPDSEEGEEQAPVPPAKKRKVEGANELPPLPASFLDRYSSTVRTSTQDDPSLHGGRKRVMPHVEGNWPTHVYLEWHPKSNDFDLLSRLVCDSQRYAIDGNKQKMSIVSSEPPEVKSLLENDLGVALPLHVSLSRPLILKTTQKEAFLDRLKQSISGRSLKTFGVKPSDLAWHPNEDKTRWFLVLRLRTSTGLHSLLNVCNDVASSFEQPLLYAERGGTQKSGDENPFHVSLAWSLQPPVLDKDTTKATRKLSVSEESGIPYELIGQLVGLPIRFSEVKVRIGQDVHSIALRPNRRVNSGLVQNEAKT